MQDFTGVNAERLNASLRTLKTRSGKEGVPVINGPLTGAPSPNINGFPVNPQTPQVATMPRESYVRNDGDPAAAKELTSRRYPAQDHFRGERWERTRQYQWIQRRS